MSVLPRGKFQIGSLSLLLRSSRNDVGEPSTQPRKAREFEFDFALNQSNQSAWRDPAILTLFEQKKNPFIFSQVEDEN